MTADLYLIFHICGQKCGNKDILVWDQCHIKGQYTGSAHQDRNLKLRINPKQFKIPVIFHNLQGYDSHFIMQEIGTIGKEHDFHVREASFIPGQFPVHGQMAANLPADAFKCTSKVLQDEKLSLIKKKGVYPHDYMRSFQKFDDKE